MIDAEYQQGQLGWWLMTRWQPEVSSGQTLLIFPPFAEEANRSRRLFSTLCQQLCAQGWDCYLPDFYGTGDSEGDFSAADLDLWQQDLCQWLVNTELQQPVHLLACRFGALQLLQLWPALQQHIQLGKVLLWQPLLDGQKFLQQLFRQHQATTLLKNDTKTSASQLLANDSAVDIAGYRITPQFYRQMNALESDVRHLSRQPLCWLELSTLTQLPLPVVKAWQHIAPVALGSKLRLLPLPPFWLQQEPLPVDLLISESFSFLAGDSHD